MDKIIDQWYADKCGVTLYPHGMGRCYRTNKGTIPPEYQVWSIQDTRCREVIRERFSIRTEFHSGYWHCSYWKKKYSLASVSTKGKTIAEAETACITSIYEQEK